MQPTFLPWSGYFNLIKQVDKFVFLDDVQFERRSWQTRNRILLRGKEHVLIVPVKKVDRGTPINEIKISNEVDWRKDHWQTLKSAYGKAAHGVEALQILEPFYTEEVSPLLSEFSQGVIRRICSVLGIETRFFCASELNCEGNRSMHLIKICEAMRCDEYISPLGSMQYLAQDDFCACTTTRLKFQEYTPKPYTQFSAAEFVSHLSVIDVIANNGLEFTKTYIV